MSWRLLFLVSLLAAATLAQANTIDVPPGDVAALQRAIGEANAQAEGLETTLYVTGLFVFSPDEYLPVIERPIRILGGTPTEFRGEDRGPLRLIQVAEGGSLSLQQIEFSDFHPDSWAIDEEARGFIEVSGRLDFEDVQFKSVYGETWCAGHGPCADPRPVFYNYSSGEIRINRASFVNSGTAVINLKLERGGLLENHGSASISNSQVMLFKRSSGWIRPFRNDGQLQIIHSSFAYFSASGSGNELMSTLDSGQAEFGNNVFSGFDGLWCDVTTSLGGNLVDSPSCSWAAEGDLTGKPAGLIWRAVNARWRPLKNALVPSAASLAVDSAQAALCPEDHLLHFSGRGIDGNGDRTAGCDRGAVELRPIGLGEGGINGFYYNPQDDGHYVYIQQTDFTTLVMWNTFDPDGNHVWVYGTGTLVNGRSVIADAYINRSAGFSPMGIVTDVEAEPWGRLEVDMESCTKGSVAYYSEMPEFGSGQFPVERLAYVKQLGCIDQ